MTLKLGNLSGYRKETKNTLIRNDLMHSQSFPVIISMRKVNMFVVQSDFIPIVTVLVLMEEHVRRQNQMWTPNLGELDLHQNITNYMI
jgi:hypothetical protein